MPHFASCKRHAGCDTYICQMCATVLCSGCFKPEWRPDITGHASAGNVCPACVKVYSVEPVRI